MRRILFICISMLVTSLPACAQSVIRLARIAAATRSGRPIIRAICAPRSQRSVQIRSPLPRRPSSASRPRRRNFATSLLPRPMYCQAYAI